jgi:tetratricopeptide (TPR) repeat protein
MPPRPLPMSPSYLAMVRGVRELHRLSTVGKDDSPEADAIRDATDCPWEGISEVERQRVRNLSEDLYSLVEPPPAPQPIDPEAKAGLSEATEARQRGEWDKALDLLRRWRAYIDPALVSFLRGSIWLEAGDPETAMLFFEHASKQQPDNGNYQAMFLYALSISDPATAKMRVEQILRGTLQTS